jgi:tetratricopeptide (TPR) repeat protein
MAARSGDAIAVIEEADAQARAIQRIGGYAMLLVRLGEAYLQAGRRADALRCAREALVMSRQHTERGHEAHALRLLGELGLIDPPGSDESDTFYREAIARAEELEMRPLLAQCHLGLSRRRARVGDHDSARSHRDVAVALFRALDMPFWLEQVQTEPA